MFEELQYLNRKIEYTPLSGSLNHAANFMTCYDKGTVANLINNLMEINGYTDKYIYYIDDEKKIDDIRFYSILDFCSLGKFPDRIYFVSSIYLDNEYLIFSDDISLVDEVLTYIISSSFMKERGYTEITPLAKNRIPKSYQNIPEEFLRAFEARRKDSYYSIIFTIDGYISIIE